MENNDFINEIINVKENIVNISESRLKFIALNSYEKGRIKLEKLRFCDLYHYSFSVAFTLLFSFFTADYKPVGKFSSEQVTVFAYGLFAVILLVGICSLVQHIKVALTLSPTERDAAVNIIIKEALGRPDNESTEEEKISKDAARP